ncbi:methyltransferase domain-containing protein [Salinispirillum sp. LH 10-3-1]|uniref:Methyltransferase domain-containing protein n=1 Tax=Salinispirillum sp. LH 10-3-1 TaxID=2952525 RepID=A0AB38YJL4_9GAMM
MTSGDVSFSHLVDRFQKNIYDSRKGQIRMAIVSRAMQPFCQQEKPLRVLDAAGGLGQMTALFAGHGHRVTYNDLAPEMLVAAQRNLPEGVGTAAIKWAQGPLQALQGQFDLVLGHAVLEWLVEPKDGLASLCDRVAPGGYLSLLFYNAESIIFKNLLKGNLRKATSNHYAGDRKGLTPVSPLNILDVESWLSDLGMNVTERLGVRCFTDFMWPLFKDNPRLEDQIELEWELGQRLEYRPFARYLHYIVHKPE